MDLFVFAVTRIPRRNRPVKRETVRRRKALISPVGSRWAMYWMNASMCRPCANTLGIAFALRL
ncbi:hypothetical protein ACIBK8_28305 [Streptomyces sp. NPDC050161]|uniref:hypothetical protein n=1 Tax=Streptomyces sp. NPDC050161 TaxID=3365604 RepID=UPI0037B8BB85